MFVLLVATLVVLTAFAAVGVVALVIVTVGALKKRKARRHALLTDGLERLKTVVAALLARVNDLDLLIGYQTKKSDADSSKTRVAVVANDLVKVTDTLPAIEQLIDESRFDDAADLLSASCRLIDKDVRIITQLESGMRGISAKNDSGVTINLAEKNTLRTKKAEK